MSNEPQQQQEQSLLRKRKVRQLTVGAFRITLPPEEFLLPERTAKQQVKLLWHYLSRGKFYKAFRTLAKLLWDSSEHTREDLRIIVAQQARGQTKTPQTYRVLARGTHALLTTLANIERQQTIAHTAHRDRTRVEGEDVATLESVYQGQKEQFDVDKTAAMKKQTNTVQLRVAAERNERAKADVDLEIARAKTEKHLYGTSIVQIISLLLALCIVALAILKGLSIEIVDIYDPKNTDLKDALGSGFEVATTILSGLSFILITTQAALLALNKRTERDQESDLRGYQIQMRAKKSDAFDKMGTSNEDTFDLLGEEESSSLAP